MDISSATRPLGLEEMSMKENSPLAVTPKEMAPRGAPALDVTQVVDYMAAGRYPPPTMSPTTWSALEGRSDISMAGSLSFTFPHLVL